MSGLIARLNTGALLYDTRNISFGLVKSGYLSYVENWRRFVLKGINVNPNLASSWVDDSRLGDNQYGFTISDAVSPVVFLSGRGVVTGVKTSGTTKTYLFAGASAATKYYCFDLMRDDSAQGPFLKARVSSNVLTFNSSQIPLNVVASVIAPAQGALDSYGRFYTTYAGGRNERVAYQTQSVSAIVHSLVDVNLSPGAEYAAYLPWSRSCGIVDAETIQSGYTLTTYGMTEGAFGRSGGISFLFAPPGRTTKQDWTADQAASTSYHSLPTDRRPEALVINTSGLPFPFN